MAHLSGFGLENFRVFKEYTWFDFAPITILVGPNNSGKSSLIKALLLLKDNVEKGYLPPTINIDGYDGAEGYEVSKSTMSFDNYIAGLNSPTSVLANGSDNDVLTFAIPYDFSDYQTLLYVLSYKVDPKSDDAQTITNIKITTKDGHDILVDGGDSLYFDLSLYNSLTDGSMADYLVDKVINSCIRETFQVDLETWFLRNNFSNAEYLAKKVLQRLKINDIVFRILHTLKFLSYWSTSRNDQKRVYTEDENSNFKNLLKDFRTAQKNFQTDKFLKEYSELFDIKDGISFLYESEKGAYFPNINNSSLVNYGYGYTQIASLLFNIAVNMAKYYDNMTKSFDESVLILEEPEANLHPKAQSKLADLFAKTAKQQNIQFIIETHSEYLIRKLQYLTAKGELKPEDVVIYYFNDPNNTPVGEKQVKKINILEDGSLSDDFGPGFYDEADNLAINLFNLQKSRRN